MMKTVLMVAVMALSLQAAEPIKTTDAEKVATLKLQRDVANIEREMASMTMRYQRLQEAQQNIANQLKANLETLRKAHKCEDCEMDDSLDLIRPKKDPPKPEPAKGN